MGAPMRYQPQGRARLDPANSLARWLVSYTPLPGKSYFDVVDGSAWVGSGPVTYDGAPRGLGMRVRGATPTYVTRPLPAAITSSATQPLTMRFRLYFHSTAPGSIMSWGATPQDGAPRFYARVSGNNELNFFFAGTYHYTVPVLVEREYILTHTFDGALHSTYLNGVLVGTSPGAWAGNFAAIFLGIGFDGPRATSDFLLSDFALLNRALSAQEVASDAQNPWQVIQAPEEENFEAAAPKTYTLAAAAGSFNLAGNSAVLAASRKLSTAPGGFSLAGRDVGLRSSRTMPTLAGAFVTTGRAISLTAARRMPAASGVFALAGTPAALVRASRVAAAAGGYSVAGSPVSLTEGRQLLTEAGVYSLAGSPVALRTGHRLAAAAGAYALIDTPAVLRTGRSLSAPAGAYTLTSMLVLLVTSAGQNTPPPYVPPSRTVNFGGGTNRVNFDGGTNRVDFDGNTKNRGALMSEAYIQNGKAFMPKDPDDIRWYKFGFARDLSDSQTSPHPTRKPIAICAGVALAEHPDGVQNLQVIGTDVYAYLGGLDLVEGKPNFCTIRMFCENGEQLDRTMYYVREDH